MLYKRVSDAPEFNDRVTRIDNMRLAPGNRYRKTWPRIAVHYYRKLNRIRTETAALICEPSRGYANGLRGNFNRDVSESAAPAGIGRDDAENGQTFRVIRCRSGHSHF